MWFVFEIMVYTFRQLALLAARLFALTASVCAFLHVLCIPLGHSLARDINGADTGYQSVGSRGGIRVEGACVLLFKSR